MKCLCITIPAALLLAFLWPAVTAAKTINVPADEPTIQAGINSASTGDIVLVASGTYNENINFMGKAITVMSASGAASTIINGGAKASVVTFDTGEGSGSLLMGFTIENGAAVNFPYDGGGVMIVSASPRILRNIIQNNVACDGGGGVYVDFSSAVVQANIIRNNAQSGCSGGVGGGGVAIIGSASAQLIGNTISNNSWSSSSGGGITLFSAGTPLVENNYISNNSAGSEGGGIWLVNSVNELLIQNVLYSNSAPVGAGMYISVPSGDAGPVIVNNTVANNPNSTEGSAIYTSGFVSTTIIENNIFTASSTLNAVYCDTTYTSTPPLYSFNDAFSAQGSALGGSCSTEGGQNSNLTANPEFVNTRKSDFQLMAGSPAINAGNPSAPNLPKRDILGHPRKVDGKVDMGAYEYQP